MESGRIKNIVIVILLLLDAVLLSMVAARRVRQTRAVTAARSAAAEVIRSEGIRLEDAALPEPLSLTPMEAARDAAAEERAARALLGDDVEIESPGGGVTRCRSERGSIQFHSTGDLLAAFTPGAFPVGEGQTPTQHGAQILAKLGFEARVQSDGVKDGTGTVTCRQTLQGAPLLGCRASLRYEDGALVQISGARRLIGPPARNGRAVTGDPATALMGVWHGLTELGDPCREILEIAPAYECSVTLSGGARLAPVWWVRTDAGEYRMDVHGASLTRVTE